VFSDRSKSMTIEVSAKNNAGESDNAVKIIYPYGK
jgi:hypothetical protein